MVVGAYTIINTIGLLVGLPVSINQSNAEPSYDLNNNFSYFLDEGTNDFSGNPFIILEFENSVSTIQNIVDNVSLIITYNHYDFRFEAYSIVDNRYIVYDYHSGSVTTDNTNYISFDFTVVNLGTNSYTLNNVYMAYPTNTLSNMNSESIISSITSGLGLMGDITTNFKNGFSALIWNSEKNSLTTFGNFALIFLGVSITFAIIKLCLNLIRSKTGV